MQEKYKFVAIFFIFFISFSFCDENNKNIAIFGNYNENLDNDVIISMKYLIDYAEKNIIDKYPNINLLLNEDRYNKTLKQILTYAFSKNQDGIFFIEATFNNGVLSLNIKLYSYISEFLYEDKFYFTDINNFKVEELENWIKIFYNGVDILLKSKTKPKINISVIKDQFKNIRDFPLVNLSLSALSLKLYMDGRTSIKIFSFFPVDLRVSFFPVKYFEAGLFLRLDYNNMVYKYLNLSDNKYYYYDSYFNFVYGIFCGLSFFSNIAHYSFGLQFYNILYDLSNNKNFIKPENVNGYLLPQFAFYQKLDIKIFKSISYSLFFNIKTMPMFILDKKNNFYSNPFNYDFIVVEFSLVGISVTF